MYDRQIFILISFLAGGLCLECYRCYHASDPSLCRHHVTCASGQSCSQRRFVDFYGANYDLDCIDTAACHRTDRTDLPNILGKRAQSLDIFCCDTDLCHTDSTTSVTNVTTSAVLTSSTEPSTVAEVKTTLTSDACVDHPDCDVLLNDFDACNDTYVAMTVCRKSCAVCDVTTNAPSCFDVHQDCKILSEHLNVCENENFARTRCAQTCGVCGSTTPSWTYTTTTESTNSSENANTTEPVEPTYTTNPTIAVTTEATDLCEDRKDCVLLREINVCSSSLTAQLCPEYCGLCLNGSLTDNATFATMQPSIPATFNETIIVSTTDSEIYATSTKNTPHCVDTLSGEDCRKVVSDNPSGCLDEIINRMCAQTCKACVAETSTPKATSVSTSGEIPLTTLPVLSSTTTTNNPESGGAMGVVVVG